MSKNDVFQESLDSEIVSLYEKIRLKFKNVDSARPANNNASDVESAKRARYSMISFSDIRNELESFRINGMIGSQIDVLLKCLLAIKPTSIVTERTFSICRNFVKFNRLRISSKKLDKLLFINQNFNKFVL